ncbi:hypothetical protein ACFOPX_01645 [Helicobacter baculiformis]|uniref:Uncharacterized protein n=2 Tax=Helicobacter baculiformis TaxID=427351 RepID=A0ABV7ZG41_9HELI
MAQELTELKQQRHIQDNKLDDPQTEVQDQELGQVQEDLEQQAPTQDISIAKGEQEVTEKLGQIPQNQEVSEQQEFLQSIAIFQDEIQEVLTEHPNRHKP